MVVTKAMSSSLPSPSRSGHVVLDHPHVLCLVLLQNPAGSGPRRSSASLVSLPVIRRGDQDRPVGAIRAASPADRQPRRSPSSATAGPPRYPPPCTSPSSYRSSGQRSPASPLPAAGTASRARDCSPLPLPTRRRAHHRQHRPRATPHSLTVTTLDLRETPPGASPLLVPRYPNAAALRLRVRDVPFHPVHRSSAATAPGTPPVVSRSVATGLGDLREHLCQRLRVRAACRAWVIPPFVTVHLRRVPPAAPARARSPSAGPQTSS